MDSETNTEDADPHLADLNRLLWSKAGEAAVDAILAEKATGWMFDNTCPSGAVFACKHGSDYGVWMSPGWDDYFVRDGRVVVPVQITDSDGILHPSFEDEPNQVLALSSDPMADLRVFAEMLAAMCVRVDADAKEARISEGSERRLREQGG